MKLTSSNPQGIILSAVKQYKEFIAPTYGPAGKSVLLDNHGYSRLVDDGQMALKEFELPNELENAVVTYIKGGLDKTNTRVGDGTTTCGLLIAAIVENVLEDQQYSLEKGIYEKHARELRKALPEAVKAITKAAKKIETEEQLFEVALNSFNNESIAKLIAKTIYEIGKDGVLAVEDSQTMETSVEVVQGLKLEKGLFSPYLGQNGVATLQDTPVIVINSRIDTFSKLLDYVKPLIDAGNKSFVVIADGFSDDTLNGCIINLLRGAFHTVLIEAPGFGAQKQENLEDVAAIVGSKVIEPRKNEKIDQSFYGHAKKVIAGKETKIIGGAGTKASIKAYTDGLKEQSEKAQKYDQERFKKRIAALNGGIAVLKVGANTENEQITVKAKVEDAISATKAAFKAGVVPGAGKSLSQAKTSSDLMNKILKAPEEQLRANGTDYLDENVFDPAEVLISALESAVSIGTGLITMGGIVTNKRKPEKED